MTTKMEYLGDVQRRLPIEISRAVWRVEEAAESGLASDYPTRCQQQRRRENAREVLAIEIEKAIAAARQAGTSEAAALDEARERIVALERQAEIATDALERQRVEIAYLRRQLKEAEPLLFGRADRVAWRLIEKMQQAGRGQLVSINGACRYLSGYETQDFIRRWDRAIDRCHRIARGEPAFGEVA